MSGSGTVGLLKGGDDSTLATDVSSDFGQLSLASSSSKPPIRHRRHSVDNGDGVRTKYLHRLGFGVSSKSEHADVVAAGPANTSSHKALTPCIISDGHRLSSSLDDRLLIPTPRQHSKRQERLILLRRSERYTVNLKFDESSDSDEVTKPKFELSSAWTNFLSSSFNSLETSQSSNPEPLDGAYDLFSLPSDSSLNIRPNSSDSTTNMACSADSQATIPSLLRRESSRTSRGELSNLSASRRPPRKVSFDSTVIATTIPSRFSYSDRIRSRLWSSTNDIHANAIRNEHEFIYEQWRTASEDAELSLSVSFPSSGQVSAPIHQSEHSQPMPVARTPVVARHYEETDIFDSRFHTSVQGEEHDVDDAFETGVFTME
ncbi:hypothetical protein ACHAWT_004852 [Skeletonema menzelii]|mmetsp:Transcript_18574/g.30406  ORF Transcript_18574/g.30406 Transcript_18574/m.30406 type:complete len:374 (+) Transcript_18574:138-1259(+)